MTHEIRAGLEDRELGAPAEQRVGHPRRRRGRRAGRVGGTRGCGAHWCRDRCGRCATSIARPRACRPPARVSRSRTTTSSLKRNQRVVAIASRRPAATSSPTSRHPARTHGFAGRRRVRGGDPRACRAAPGPARRPAAVRRPPRPRSRASSWRRGGMAARRRTRRVERVGGDVVDARHGPSGAGPTRRNSGRDGRACQRRQRRQPGAGPASAASEARSSPHPRRVHGSAASHRHGQQHRVPVDGRRRLHSELPAGRPFARQCRARRRTVSDRRISARMSRTRAFVLALCLWIATSVAAFCPVDRAADRRSVARRGRPAAEHASPASRRTSAGIFGLPRARASPASTARSSRPSRVSAPWISATCA